MARHSEDTPKPGKRSVESIVADNPPSAARDTKRLPEQLRRRPQRPLTVPQAVVRS